MQELCFAGYRRSPTCRSGHSQQQLHQRPPQPLLLSITPGSTQGKGSCSLQPPVLLQLCSASSPQAAPRLAAISAEGRTSNLAGFPLLRADGEQAGNGGANKAVL